MNQVKAKWILATLYFAPMDRIRLMKSLFLTWYRTGKSIPDYFQFVPYLYGPCSFEVYRILDELKREGLIVRLPNPVPNWSTYYLTEKGKQAAREAIFQIEPALRDRLKESAGEVTRLSFYQLLKRVYEEAPEFAINSVVKEVFKS
jgi:uncharacterized protein YwgA